jgi:hypothetical protein
VSEREEDATTDISDSFFYYFHCTIANNNTFSFSLTHSLSHSLIGNEEYCPHYYEKKASNIIQAQYCSHYNNTRRGAAVVVSLTRRCLYSIFPFLAFHTEQHTSKRFSILLIENITLTLFFSSISIQF